MVCVNIYNHCFFMHNPCPYIIQEDHLYLRRIQSLATVIFRIHFFFKLWPPIHFFGRLMIFSIPIRKVRINFMRRNFSYINFIRVSFCCYFIMTFHDFRIFHLIFWFDFYFMFLEIRMGAGLVTKIPLGESLKLNLVSWTLHEVDFGIFIFWIY